ncbi:hypothetical protein F8M41_016545 [Gigaspora margarita]|uniref:Uncharacterized protein n=1 Tax=Gigaspora margarita TaxID=4874 RepID=A0A8H4B356_GIGMA|nr:hypothetical protein F8M41_016545 [Gigaspora margarita]
MPSELPKNSSRIPKKPTRQLQNAKQNYQPIPNYQVGLPKNSSKMLKSESCVNSRFLKLTKKIIELPKNPQESPRNLPDSSKHQIELLTNSKPPSWFTKEQLQNAEVLLRGELSENSSKTPKRITKETYQRMILKRQRGLKRTEYQKELPEKTEENC